KAPLQVESFRFDSEKNQEAVAKLPWRRCSSVSYVYCLRRRPCRAHIRMHADIATRAASVLAEFPVSPPTHANFATASKSTSQELLVRSDLNFSHRGHL
ncbi:MAG TPA: hypothetical protein VK832_19785, partial [Burkholderiaceae bacterium]|nr:hypothetical protein [Burkholderiaceae bacterium]